MLLPSVKPSISASVRPSVNRAMDAFVSPDPLLLDTFSGASVACSLRKLRAAYSGSCIRVRRSSDNTEQDIGFSNNVLDTVTLLSFCGAGNGFVVTWYDQSGNANNATIATTTQQPQIVASGSVVTSGGKPAIQSNILRSGERFILAGLSGRSRLDLFYVANSTGTSGLFFYDSNSASRHGFAGTSGSSSTGTTGNYGTPLLYSNNALAASTTFGDVHTATNGRKLISHQAGNTSTWTGAGIFGYGMGFDVIGQTQEFVAFASDQSANRSAITDAMNSYWGVY